MSDDQLVRERLDALLRDHAGEQGPPFWAAQYDAGLAWVWRPEGEGGLGVDGALQKTVDAALAKAGIDPPFKVNPIGIGMAAPTIQAHGTDEQRARWLRPLFSGEEIWCQLFSEPGAGSDLAGLATKAVRDGDQWLVNGQKVWTSLAHRASWGLLVARSDPEQFKHRGLTYFGFNMHSTGVETRPLRQMTGSAEFNEVYMTDVTVPDSDRIGDVGGGWGVAMTTLTAERINLGAAMAPRSGGPMQEVLRLWRELPDERRTAKLEARVTDLYVEAEAFAHTVDRMRVAAAAGRPGPDGGVIKILMAHVNQAAYELCVDLLGPDGTLYPMGYADDAGDVGTASNPSPDVRQRFLRARANSIEGGTTEILRNTLGERVLGLPRDPAVDRDIPWSQIPRG
jgi:alkylation response protein AidB-like acyl-CoA dehydrogenase